jgi:hypothetical protein
MVDNNEDVLFMDDLFKEAFLKHCEVISYLEGRLPYWKTKSDQNDIESNLIVSIGDRVLVSFDPPFPEKQSLVKG